MTGPNHNRWATTSPSIGGGRRPVLERLRAGREFRAQNLILVSDTPYREISIQCGKRFIAQSMQLLDGHDGDLCRCKPLFP